MAVKYYGWNSANIVVWNRVKFPDNTPQKQLAKLSGEIKEWREARGEQRKLEELADIYIATAGLMRFDGIYRDIGSFVCFALIQLDGKDCRLKDAIDAKMIINRQRDFDENMHHI
jgi:hypothetical protein